MKKVLFFSFAVITFGLMPKGQTHKVRHAIPSGSFYERVTDSQLGIGCARNGDRAQITSGAGKARTYIRINGEWVLKKRSW